MLKKILLISFVLLVAFTLAIINYGLKELDKPLQLSEESATYTVQPGASVKRVLNDFTSNGWITQPRLFELWLRYNKQTNIQRGEYELSADMTAVDAIQKFIDGKKILRSVQFIEGKTFKDNLKALADNPWLEQTLTGLSTEDIIAKVDPQMSHPEGWFFPDTYLFESGTSDLEILQLAHQRTVDVLEQEWSKKSDKAMVNTPYEALILASIIEKETGAGFERPMISGVFTRRLKLGMRLQTDPTVIYGVGEAYDGNLTRTHLRTDTPYNTYTRKGLPPTPIANAGKEAIVAALNPADGDAIFFVAKGDGTHQFSVTLDEHNAAVRKYQRFGRRSDYQSAPAAIPSEEAQ